MKKYRAIGIMSGTSLDGLDIVLCEFEKKGYSWDFSILEADTLTYSKEWKQKLLKAPHISGLELCRLDNDYGTFIGESIKNFLKSKKIKIDLIASHGHTLFHQPSDGLTFQIGNGANIASATTITTVCNFRALDVALKGQGAPLVPIGDLMLFPEYYYCLNMGGFANISYTWYKKRLAFDICPVNIIINKLANEIGKEFDQDGRIAGTGKVHQDLLILLNKITFYFVKPPKSLSREWVEKEFIPIIEKYNISIEDKLRTIYEHIAKQINRTLDSPVKKKILVTGGGAYNKFLIGLLKEKSHHQFVIPDPILVEYKEALIFAFLGTLRLRHENNCLSSVTGASHDNIGGVIYRI